MKLSSNKKYQEKLKEVADLTTELNLSLQKPTSKYWTSKFEEMKLSLLESLQEDFCFKRSGEVFPDISAIISHQSLLQYEEISDISFPLNTSDQKILKTINADCQKIKTSDPSIIFFSYPPYPALVPSKVFKRSAVRFAQIENVREQVIESLRKRIKSNKGILTRFANKEKKSMVV